MKSKTTYSHAPTIAIIGAGLGGLSLARMMHVLGLQAAVYDKDRTASERSIGGSLDMHEETGLYAIRQAGLFDQFEQLARYEDQGMRLFHRDGDLLFETHDQNRPEIDRGQLREILLASIPPGWFHWDHDLQYVRESPAGGFDLLFRGGRRRHADFVAGADGVWSSVRAAVTGLTPRYSGLTFFELEIEHVDQAHPEVARFLSHGLNMAMADEKLISAQRNAAGNVRVYAALFVPEDGRTQTGYPTVKPKNRSEILDQFAGWNPQLVHLFEAAEPSVRPWPIYVMPIDAHWPHKPGITLLGDAAHAMPPAGDGANLAMRDGVDLAHALAHALDSSDDIDQAVAAFEAAMFARAEDAAKMASACLLEGSSEDRLALIQQAMALAD